MSLPRNLASLFLGLPLSAAIALASSPTPPVDVRLEPDGPRNVRLVIATTASGDYAVTARRTGARPGELAAAPRLTEGIVSKEKPVLVKDAIAKDAAAGDVVHVNYQVEVVNDQRGYHGVVGVDQAFAVQGDLTLRPITFEQELELKAGPAPATAQSADVTADAPSPVAR